MPHARGNNRAPATNGLPAYHKADASDSAMWWHGGAWRIGSHADHAKLTPRGLELKGFALGI